MPLRRRGAERAVFRDPGIDRADDGVQGWEGPVIFVPCPACVKNAPAEFFPHCFFGFCNLCGGMREIPVDEAKSWVNATRTLAQSAILGRN